ncbi:uncharacterized protein LOC134705699 [Mytilus trossulus]|uniref:uncharacterized protein LOC134705699 n=1 Tax=Mytilus trossulus TaxID=6551 RepID=UPI003005740C
MKGSHSVVVLGMIACILVFESYLNYAVSIITDQSSKKGSIRLKELTDTDNHVHPAPIVILTYMRSGSSLVGDILQQGKDVFYLFEPLRLAQFRLRKKQPYYNLDGNERLYSSFFDAGRDIIRNWTTIYRDLVTIDILSKKYPERVLTFFYEDLAKDPLKMSKQLYKFTGISYTPEVEKYVFKITMAGKYVNCGSLCTVKSNSSKAADAWRSKLNMPKARIIDRSCRPVYQRLGFREIKSEEMLKNHEIPLRVERENLNDYRYA